MSQTDILAAGIPPSHIDLVSVAVRYTLAANEKLAAWARGGIHRAEASTVPLDGLQAPNIIVAPGSEDPVFHPGEAVELSLPVAISLTWEQPIRWLEDEDPTIAGVVAEIRRCLVANYYLTVPIFGNERLVRRLHEFKPFSYDQVRESGGNSALLNFIFFADYRVTLNARSWEIMPP